MLRSPRAHFITPGVLLAFGASGNPGGEIAVIRPGWRVFDCGDGEREGCAPVSFVVTGLYYEMVFGQRREVVYPLGRIAGAGFGDQFAVLIDAVS